MGKPGPDEIRNPDFCHDELRNLWIRGERLADHDTTDQSSVNAAIRECTYEIGFPVDTSSISHHAGLGKRSRPTIVGPVVNTSTIAIALPPPLLGRICRDYHIAIA